MTDKCFRKCIGKPGGSLDNSEQVRLPGPRGGTCACADQRGVAVGPLRVRSPAVPGWARRPGPELSRAPSPPAEVHRHVHGPLHGCLEHRVPRLQLTAAAGTSQHVTPPRPAPTPHSISINALCEAGARSCILPARASEEETGAATLGRCSPPACQQAQRGSRGALGPRPVPAARRHVPWCAPAHLVPWAENPHLDLGCGQAPPEL